MPHVRMSEESYQAMVAAFRGAPGAIADAAKAAGVHPRTASTYWHKGSGDREPIKDTIAHDRDIARAELERQRLHAEAQVMAAQALVKAEGKPLMREIAREALNDRERTAIDEGHMSRVARRNVIKHLESTSALLDAAADLRDVLVTRMRTAAETQPIDVLARTIQAIGHIAKQGVEAAKTAAELERLILGEPTSHTKVTFETPNAARREIVEAMAAAQAAGLIDAQGRPIMVIDVEPD